MSLISDRPTEDGTMFIDVVFIDPIHGTDITISNRVWSLSDDSGDIINGRENVPFSGTIILTGDDLALSRTKIDSGRRVLMASATYDSQQGSNLTAIKEHIFTIKKRITKK